MMQLPDKTRAIVRQMEQVEESKHFIIRFSLRNPPPRRAGKGSGPLGVRSPHLISCYVAALESLFETLVAGPFSWRVPATDQRRKTEVYIVYLPLLNRSGEAFTSLDQDGVPYICLSCRSTEPMLQNALYRAEVEAVHEATHVFCWISRPPLRGIVEKKWRWFNEATAVLMEAWVFPGNLDSIRFGLDWSDLPEVPLDADDAQYQSGFFARYLARRFGPRLVARIWNESKPEEGPLEALNRLLPAKQRSAAATVCRIFGDYAHDSYFLWDHRSYGFANEVFLRFGSRALTESFVLRPGDSAQTKATLDHLACRYYRIEITSNVTQLEACVRVDARDSNGFRCFLSVHERTQHRGASKELKSVPSKSGRSNSYLERTFKATLQKEELPNCESVVLVVANCGIRSRDYVASRESHDDQVEFHIEICANG